MMVNGSSGEMEVLTGQVWANDAVFPDFFNQDTVNWWATQLTKMFEQIAFDGLWLGMNIASNSCTGVCYQS
jgi:alpha-D-xyloside xylohydrolase